MKLFEMLALTGLFWILIARTLLNHSFRKAMLARSGSEWAIDFIGLCIHGIVVPLFQSLILFKVLTWAFPGGRACLTLPAWCSFLAAFVGVDYLYYWNHRLLHSAGLWRFHSMHHSGESFDVFTTSRNSAITTFLILYVWVNGFGLYLLADPIPYVIGVTLSNGLDILRHARIERWPDVWPLNWLISPREHAWHHSSHKHGVNFGGNWNVWDRLHGTFHQAERLPARFGVPMPKTQIWKAFWRGLP